MVSGHRYRLNFNRFESWALPIVPWKLKIRLPCFNAEALNKPRASQKNS